MLSVIDLSQWHWFILGVFLLDIPLTVITVWAYNNRVWTKAKGLTKLRIRWRSRKEVSAETETEEGLRQMTQSLVGNALGVHYALVVRDETDYIRGLSCVLDSNNYESARLEADLRFERILEVWDADFELSYRVWRIGDE